MKRHKIIELIKQEEKYVPEEIYEILDRLSFKQLSTSQLSDWELLTKRNGNNEFTAIYNDRKKKDKRFLVEGTYSNIETPQRDLENISNYFNKGRLKRIAQSKEFQLFGGLILGGVAGMYYLAEQQEIPEALHKGLLMVPGGYILGTVASIASEKLTNRYYGSKLSKEAENYNYGEYAEKKLKEEHIFEKIKSGELTKQNYLKLRENFTEISI